MHLDSPGPTEEGNAAAFFFNYFPATLHIPQVPRAPSLTSTELAAIPTDMAHQLFQFYVGTMWYLMPLQDLDFVKNCIYDAYGLPVTPHISPVDRASMLAILAIGSTCTSYHEVGKTLHARSQFWANMSPESAIFKMAQYDLLRISLSYSIFHL